MRLDKIVSDATACTLCANKLGHNVRPVFQIHKDASILIAGQAPGSKVHVTGIPFDDRSGDRLRTWMGIDRSVFYDATKIAILPMAFCYPGKGKSGDLPPMPICAETWRNPMMNHLSNLKLILVIGQYAQSWHLPKTQRTLTETVKQFRDYPNHLLPLPHPSPRNNIWLKKNPWFEEELVPVIRERTQRALA